MMNINAAAETVKGYEKKKLLAARITAVASIITLVIVIAGAAFVVPCLMKLSPALEAASASIDSAAKQVIDADLPELSRNIDALVSSSRTAANNANDAASAALEKIEALEIEKLNDAISDLSAIVKPLARLLGR